MLRHLARVIVGRYPAAWRERYEDEVLDLLESAPVRAFDVGELFRNMLVEQVRAAIDLDQPTVAAARVMRYKTFAVVGSVVFIQAAGWALWWSIDLAESQVERLIVTAFSFYAALGVMWCVHTLRQRGKATDQRSPFPVVVALVCLPLHFAASTLWVWALLANPQTYSPRWMQILQAVYQGAYLGGPIAAWLLMQVWPGQRLVRLLMEIKMADAAVEGAKHYIASCEEWIDKGVMSPLAEAKQALELRIKERETVRARLNATDRRARFAKPQ
jgi:hypothetical protein